MKKIWITAIVAICCTVEPVTAQVALDWQKAFEGNIPTAKSAIYDINQTADGGYIAAGWGETSGGDLPSGYIDKTDVLITKLDASGAVQWSKYWGGELHEYAQSVIQTIDGGFVIAGVTSSSFSATNHGKYDGFIIKLDATGALQWKKLYGGSEDDYINCIRQNPDGTFIFTGGTGSPEINGFHGGWDVWIAKLDVDGTIIWEKTKGYSGYEEATSIELTADGGYILAGHTYSSGATNYHDNGDLWVLKLTAAGAIAWQQCIGGADEDRKGVAIEATDGSIMVLGMSSSIDGDAVGNHGYSDLLFAKLDPLGNLVFSKMFGGTEEEYIGGIIQTSDGKFLIAGSTFSNDGDVNGNNNDGYSDSWLVKVNPLGIIEWQQCIGGEGDDEINALGLSSDGGYILAGQYNNENAWIIKMKSENAGIDNLELDAKMNIYPNPASDILNIEIDWEKSQSSVLTIFDITGRVILTQSINGKDAIQMDVSKLSGGVYRVTVSDENGNVSTKQLVIEN